MLLPLPPYIKKLFLDLPMFWPTNSLYWERVRTTSRSLDPRFITTLSWLSSTATGVGSALLKPSQAGFSQNLALIWRSVNHLHFSHMSATSILQFYIILIIPGMCMLLDKDVYASVCLPSAILWATETFSCVGPVCRR